MSGKILVMVVLLLDCSLGRAQQASTTAPLVTGTSLQITMTKTDPDLDWARKWIEEFCWRMSTDYGVKVTFADFAENGTRDQIMKFAAEVKDNLGNLDAFCQGIARRMSPFFKGKAIKNKNSASANRTRRTNGGLR